MDDSHFVTVLLSWTNIKIVVVFVVEVDLIETSRRCLKYTFNYS